MEMNIICWNVRGMNDPSRERDVHELLVEHKIGIVGLLETKVKQSNVGRIENRVNGNCRWINNCGSDDAGRVFVGWDPLIYNVKKLSKSR